MYTCNPSCQEPEEGGLCECEASLGYIVIGEEKSRKDLCCPGSGKISDQVKQELSGIDSWVNGPLQSSLPCIFS